MSNKNDTNSLRIEMIRLENALKNEREYFKHKELKKYYENVSNKYQDSLVANCSSTSGDAFIASSDYGIYSNTQHSYFVGSPASIGLAWSCHGLAQS